VILSDLDVTVSQRGVGRRWEGDRSVRVGEGEVRRAAHFMC
jgi:hypothetical protein